MWGEIGSRVRGFCYNHAPDKSFGFLRVMKSIASDLWKIDSRQVNSPYESVFFHDSFLPDGAYPSDLPNRNTIFEFELAKSENRDSGFQAVNMHLVSHRR